MKKLLNLLIAGFFVADSLVTPQSEKIIKTLGDFDGNGTKEEAVYKPGTIQITGLEPMRGVENTCDSLFVIPKDGKKDYLIIHHKDGTMQRAEYYPKDESWGSMPYQK